jgi:ferredoxin-NADP reductase
MMHTSKAPKRAVPVVAPAHMLPVQVVERLEIAPDVVSLYLVLPGTKQAPAPYLPGQFVTLALPTPDDTLYRSYSLCGDGSMDQPWELTIKRVNEGAVSTYFYEHVDRGTLLYASLPRGTFTLPADLSPDMVLSFVAVGSGITPIRGMLRALAALPPQQRPLAQLFYASRSRDEVIYRDELLDLDPDGLWLRQLWYLSSEGERLSVEEVIERAGRTALRAHWFVCGPDTLKRELQSELAAMGLPDGRYHAEVFGTTTGPAYQVAAHAGKDTDGALRILDTGQELDVQPQETLLAALERHGYSPAFSCRAGACGSCKLRVVEGEAAPAGEVLSDLDRRAGYVLSCIAHPVGPVTLESGGAPPKGVPIIATGRRGRAGVRLSPRAILATWLVALVLVGAATLAGIAGLGVLATPLPRPVSGGYLHAQGEVVALGKDDTFAMRLPGQTALVWLRPAPGAHISMAHLRRHLSEHAETDVVYEKGPKGELLAVSAD